MADHAPVAAAIAERLAAVRERIASAARAVGRDPAEITLVAVSKTMPPASVIAAHAAGQRHFGENRVQEGESKIETLALTDATWHLIGHLQTNKARLAARLFDTVQSVDSLRVAQALSKEAVNLSREIEVLLEVNYAGEASKFGFSPDEALENAPAITRLPGLRVTGLMTMAPHVNDAEAVRPLFRGVRDLAARLQDQVGAQLSMGMTNDFEVAIEEGATIVRVGRAIFGDRPT